MAEVNSVDEFSAKLGWKEPQFYWEMASGNPCMRAVCDSVSRAGRSGAAARDAS